MTMSFFALLFACQVVFYGAKAFCFYDKPDLTQPLLCGLDSFCLVCDEGYAFYHLVTTKCLDKQCFVTPLFQLPLMIYFSHSQYILYVSTIKLKRKSVFSVEYMDKCCNDVRLQSVPAACAYRLQTWVGREQMIGHQTVAWESLKFKEVRCIILANWK